VCERDGCGDVIKSCVCYSQQSLLSSSGTTALLSSLLGGLVRGNRDVRRISLWLVAMVGMEAGERLSVCVSESSDY